MKPKLLMCSPEHFGIQYAINPWMDPKADSIDARKAHKEWEALHRALGERAEVFVLTPRPGMPDMVFTANAGLLVDGTFVPSRFKHKERRPEEPVFREWFQEYAENVVPLPEGLAFEGEGDALRQPGRDWIWAGYGPRTSREAHSFLEKTLNRPVISLHLVDPYFYHLDTCFCPLPGDGAMYYPGAFDDASLEKIEARIAPENRILVSREDAERFACNAVRLGKTMFVNDASPELRGKLEKKGLEVVLCPVEEFLKAGGANKCLTLVLDDGTGPESVSEGPQRASVPR